MLFHIWDVVYQNSLRVCIFVFARNKPQFFFNFPSTEHVVCYLSISDIADSNENRDESKLCTVYILASVSVTRTGRIEIPPIIRNFQHLKNQNSMILFAIGGTLEQAEVFYQIAQEKSK